MTDAEDRQVVRYEMVAEHVALVTLDRPEKRNAVNAALANQLDACVKRSESDPDVRVVILTSSNDKAFCAGADLAEAGAGKGRTCYTPDGGFAGLVSAKRRKPWIAAAKGSVLAGGMELCLACDMIVAAEDARFGLPEVKRSFVPIEGGVTRLPKKIPLAIAVELIVTGDPIDARRAYELGLVNRVAPADQVLDVAVSLARSVAVNAPLAVYEALGVAKQAPDFSDADIAQLGREAMQRLRATEDFKEGPRAFLEKRAPVWTGK